MFSNSQSIFKFNFVLFYLLCFIKLNKYSFTISPKLCFVNFFATLRFLHFSSADSATF